MIKQTLRVLYCFVFIFSLGTIISGTLCKADSTLPEIGRRDYGFGWQYFKPASGLSLKIPIHDDFYFQPIIAFAVKDEAQSGQKNWAIGVRGIYDFPGRYGFKPYAGVAMGHSVTTVGASQNNAAVTKVGDGYQAFFGVEYQKYLLRPAVEMGLGGYWSPGGTFEAGMVFNVSLLYYF